MSRTGTLPTQSRQRHTILFVVVACCAFCSAAFAEPKRPLDPIAAKIEPVRTVTYKQISDRQLKLHVFEPDGHKSSDRRSAFVIFHGGGWTGGSPRRTYPFADHFRKLGMVGISVEYRLLRKDSGVTVFDCVKDGRSAVRYVRQHAEELGVEPQKIIVAGCSAGGHVVVSSTSCMSRWPNSYEASDAHRQLWDYSNPEKNRPGPPLSLSLDKVT